MIRTINNTIRTLLFQACLPPSYWVEALNVAAHVLNITPSKAIQNQTPYTLLSISNQTMLTYAFLVACAFQTSITPISPNSLQEQQHVYFFVIHLSIVGIDA